jgi:hypothetical protein
MDQFAITGAKKVYLAHVNYSNRDLSTTLYSYQRWRRNSYRNSPAHLQ